MECFHCDDKGRIINEEWDREWDRHDRNSPSHYDTNLWMERSGIPKYDTCTVCKGSRKIEVLRATDMIGKNVRSLKVESEVVNEYILLRFEDGTIAKIPSEGFLYVK
ncbi:hypothetical protein [Paenibacillus sp. Z3-2]